MLAEGMDRVFTEREHAIWSVVLGQPFLILGIDKVVELRKEHDTKCGENMNVELAMPFSFGFLAPFAHCPSAYTAFGLDGVARHVVLFRGLLADGDGLPVGTREAQPIDAPMDSGVLGHVYTAFRIK